jgi:uncharacterized protein (TIGR03118 family)
MSDPIISLRRRLLLVATAAGLATALALPAGTAQAAPKDSRFAQVNVVADRAGVAPITDPLLVNPWGLTFGPTTPLWVANNGTGTSTLYSGNGTTTPFAKVPLEVTVSGGLPTGTVFNSSTGFVVGTPPAGGPARFIFDGITGDVTGWNPAAAPTTALVKSHQPGNVYTGLALLPDTTGAFLLAADFSKGRIDVFDSSWNPVDVGDAFTDPTLPAGYAPFNVAVLGGAVYVAYAKVDPATGKDQAGHNLGFVDRYTDVGRTVERVASRGNLNAPWGLAIAPASFGKYAGSLLVGNFGDGKIGAYTDDGDFLGFLRDADNDVIVIDGLWALLPGTVTTGGTNAVWFSSGPDDETHGLVGLLRPSST